MSASIRKSSSATCPIIPAQNPYSWQDGTDAAVELHLQQPLTLLPFLEYFNLIIECFYLNIEYFYLNIYHDHLSSWANCKLCLMNIQCIAMFK